jgi:periplasmic protein TonB
MEKDKKYVPEWEEMLFEKRNKEYGAYNIRKVYKKTLSVSLWIGITIVLLAVGIPLIASMAAKKRNVNIDKDVTAEMATLKKPEDAPPPPPPPPPPPERIERQVTFTIPQVVDTVKEEVQLTTTDDLLKNTQNTSLDTNAVVVQNTEQKEEVIEKPKEVFVIVEEPPEFPGGEDALRKYVAENTKYPAVARENNIQGKVYVRFVVTYDGSVEQVSIVRKVDPLLEEEAMRVVRALPKFKPGKQRGRPVNVWYTLPIVFQLQGNQ